jgi:hypothetical protein
LVCMSKFQTLGHGTILLAVALLAAADETESGARPNTIARDRVATTLFDGLAEEKGPRFLEKSANQPSQAVAGVISYGSWRDGARGPIVVLTDGSRIAGNVTSPGPDQIEIEPFSTACKSITATPSQVRAICYDPPRDPRTRDRWWASLFRSAREFPTDDALHLQDESVVYGTIESLGDEATVRFRARGDKKAEDLSLEPLRALVWGEKHHPVVPSQAGDASVGLTGGMLLQARQVTPNKSGRGVTVELASGVQVELEALQPTYWRSESATTVSLTTVEPLGFRHQPLLGEPGNYEVVADGTTVPAIRVADELWPRGIRQPSASRLAFDLPKGATHFSTRIAVEQLSRYTGSVRFRVFGGEGESWKPLFESEVVRGGHDSIPLVVALNGATRIALVVDMADGNDVGDNAVWIDPVVTLSRDPRPPVPAAGSR